MPYGTGVVKCQGSIFFVLNASFSWAKAEAAAITKRNELFTHDDLDRGRLIAYATVGYGTEAAKPYDDCGCRKSNHGYWTKKGWSSRPCKLHSYPVYRHAKDGL